jgi:hypothetical protein
MRIAALSGWKSEQRHVVAASFLGWSLDAFDFFLLVFVLKDIAKEFNTQITDVTFATSPVWLAVGAFLMQVMVQGAWGVIPVHLNELSPDEARGTFPGFVYQLGNLIECVNATLQAGIAGHYGGNYGVALGLVAGTVAIVIAVLTARGVEAKGVVFGKARIRGDQAGLETAVSPVSSSG